jgi:hypothetical protein
LGTFPAASVGVGEGRGKYVRPEAHSVLRVLRGPVACAPLQGCKSTKLNTPVRSAHYLGV